MPPPPRPALSHFLFQEPDGALDRYEALLVEDDAARHAEYDKPDPRRRRLRVACNECQTPWCCYQRVDVGLVEALVLYRWAARHQPAQLDLALQRGKELLARAPSSGRRRIGPDEEDDDGSDHFRRRLACPFLVKGRCSVYPVRPQACRVHYMAGNPQKCRDELKPRDTYAMSPDHGLLAELETIDEDVRFFGLVGEQRVRELSQLLLLVDGLHRAGRWKAPRDLDWRLVSADSSTERE